MRRSGILVIGVVAALVVAGGAVAGYLLLRSPGPECTVPRPSAASAGAAVGPGPAAAATNPSAGTPAGTAAATDATTPLHLDAVQLQHASTISAVGMARGLPERARVIAIATAWQESSLRNLDHGDRDSLGLFQQRASQGWGTAAEIMDPVYAAGEFYDHLVKVPDWQQLSLTQAAQKVQRSAFPEAYAKWEPNAIALAVQLGGTVPPTLSCRSGAVASTAPAPARKPVAGLDGASQPLRAALAAAQAELSGLEVRSVSPDGDTATVSVTLPNSTADDAGRALAAWAVAHSTSMSVSDVTVLGRQWRGHRWSTAPAPLPAGQVTIGVTAGS